MGRRSAGVSDVQFNGQVAEDFFKDHWKLRDVGQGVPFMMDSAPLGAMWYWFCPELFEQIATIDEELTTALENYKPEDEGTKRAIETAINKVSFKYLALINKKIKCMLPRLTDYFIERSKVKEAVEHDQKIIEEYGVEVPTIKFLDRF